MPNQADEVARREVGVLVSTIVSLIASIALDFGISAHTILYFSRQRRSRTFYPLSSIHPALSAEVFLK